MNSPTSSRRSLVSRFLHSWYLPTAVLVVLLIGLAVWLWPRRSEDVVSVDGQHRWSKASAPPLRGIVWQPATPLDAPVPEAGPRDSLIRPQFADGGSTLYFTLRNSDGSADIYRSSLTAGIWERAEPADELNSTSDDIGPVISPDGRELYLYSNRPGGEGGFDIYVSRRTGSGWSEPRNMGRGVNTPAHEFDAAVSEDGTSLYFASNRTPQMQQRVSEGVKDDAKEWSATLRAQQGLPQFDIYLTRRDTPNDGWRWPQSVAGLNRKHANEGAPFVAPNGIFLYFASDRPNNSGGSNYDIYRARIVDDGVTGIENLGKGVNSPANETEPALSPEGFRILFSSDRLPTEDGNAQPEPDGRYALYSSTAVETYNEVTWDTSNLQAFVAFLSANWWWFVLCLLIAALLASLAWLIRQWSLRRLPVPGFLLIALLVHLLIGAATFFVYFDEIKQTVKQAFEELFVASNLHQSHDEGQQAYEKTADLKSVQSVKPADVPRQVTETPNMPVPTDSPLPSLPMKVGLAPVLETVTEPPPRLQTPSTESPQLVRRNMTALERVLEQERVNIEQPQAAEANPQQTLQQLDVELDRRPPQPQVASTTDLLQRRTLNPAMQLARDQIPAERVETQPTESETDEPSLERLPRAVSPAADSPMVETEMVKVIEPAKPQDSLARLSIDVDRIQPSPRAATLPQALQRKTMTPDSAKPIADATPVERIIEQPDVAKTPESRMALDRASRQMIDPAEPPDVKPAELNEATPPKPDQQLARLSVDLARTPPKIANPSMPELPQRSPRSGAALELTPDRVPVERVAQQPESDAETPQPLKLDRSPAARTAPLESAAVPTENIAGPAPQTNPESQLARLSIDVMKNLSSSQPAALPQASDAPQPLETAKQVAI